MWYDEEEYKGRLVHIMLIKLLILTVVGGVIGWVTNVLAIKMLFRPIHPITIPLIKFKLQGLIPRRRSEIAQSIGDTIETELIKINDIIDQLVTDENKSEVLNKIKERVLYAVSNKIPTLIPSAMKAKVLQYIGEQIDNEASSILEKTIEDLTKTAIEKVKISQMVVQKIDELELEKVEEMIFKISSNELKHIEILGGVLGAIIGLFQGIIVIMI